MVYHIITNTGYSFRCTCGWDTFNIMPTVDIYKLVADHAVKSQYKVETKK